MREELILLNRLLEVGGCHLAVDGRHENQFVSSGFDGTCFFAGDMARFKSNHGFVRPEATGDGDKIGGCSTGDEEDICLFFGASDLVADQVAGLDAVFIISIRDLL